VVLVVVLVGLIVINYYDENILPVRSDPFITDPPCTYPPETLTRLFQGEHSSDPIYAAGTIPLFNDKYVGRGSIIRKDNQISFVTAEHVAELALGNCAYYYFASSRFFALARFSYFDFSHGRRSDLDEIAMFKVTGNLLERLSVDISSGKITPLLITDYIPRIGETVAIPDPQGLFTYYIVNQVEKNYLVLVTNGQAGLICKRRSGGPVLLYRDGIVTNLVVGVISSINTGTSFKVDGNECSYIAYATRFPTRK
jgi:hypothetical protein